MLRQIYPLYYNTNMQYTLVICKERNIIKNIIYKSRSVISIIIISIISVISSMSVSASPQPSPTHIIIDSDMSTDTDDLIAIRICQQYDNEGLISLDGLMLSDENDLHEGAAAAQGILDAYGFTDVPVGTSMNPNLETDLPYWDWLSKQKTTNHSIDTAVRQYRRLLSSSSDKFGILVIGYFDNIAALLQSQPDDISQKTGAQLIAEHVSFFDICGTGKGNQGPNKQYTGFENNTCFYPSSYTSSGQFYRDIGNLHIPIYQYTGSGSLAAQCSVGGKDQLPANDIVYQSFTKVGRYNGGPGYDAISAWLLLPIITDNFSKYGIVPEQYNIQPTGNRSTAFISVPDKDGNVTMLNMQSDGNVYRSYLDDAY